MRSPSWSSSLSQKAKSAKTGVAFDSSTTTEISLSLYLPSSILPCPLIWHQGNPAYDVTTDAGDSSTRLKHLYLCTQHSYIRQAKTSVFMQREFSPTKVGKTLKRSPRLSTTLYLQYDVSYDMNVFPSHTHSAFGKFWKRAAAKKVQSPRVHAIFWFANPAPRGEFQGSFSSRCQRPGQLQVLGNVASVLRQGSRDKSWSCTLRYLCSFLWEGNEH